MVSTNTARRARRPAASATPAAPAPAPADDNLTANVTANVTAIGVGIDTARYGHMVTFLRPDRQPAAAPLLVRENAEGYQTLQQRLEQLHQRHPQAHFHVRIDAAGQYANNLEAFLRGLALPMTLSIGEPKRNRDYQLAHFPKRQTDQTESLALARFAVVELPAATAAVPESMRLLRELAGRLDAQRKQATQAVNRLHNLLARVFPELANLANDFAATWVVELLSKYPSAAKIAQARAASLTKIPYLPKAKVQPLQQAAASSVASLTGPVAESLVQQLVNEVRHSQDAESQLRRLLTNTYEQLPPGRHSHLTSIPGIGAQTAAILVGKIIDIDRFAQPENLVGYFGAFPEEHSSGVDKRGRPLPPGTLVMSPRGNDLVRATLWMAALAGIRSNPALRALYRRLKSKGKRGDVALGHCMRKLLHLVHAVWTTGQPFDPQHYPWLPESDSDTPDSDTPDNKTPDSKTPGNKTPVSDTPANDRAPGATASPPAAQATVSAGTSPETPPASPTENKKAVGHKEDRVLKKQVVTTAGASVEATAVPVNPPSGAVRAAGPAASARPAKRPATVARPKVDFAFLRQQISMEQVLDHLGILALFRGTTRQRRGPCPVHADSPARLPSKQHTCSVQLERNIFQCFQADCAAHGNVLDLWAAVHRLPLYEAALHLAATFQLPRNREEEPVRTARQPTQKTGANTAIITANGP